MSLLTLYRGGGALRRIWYTLLFYRLCQLAGLFLLDLVACSAISTPSASLRCFILTLSFAVKTTLDRSRKDSWRALLACSTSLLAKVFNSQIANRMPGLQLDEVRTSLLSSALEAVLASKQH